MGLPEEANVRVSKVRHGKTGTRSQIPASIMKRLKEQWKEKVATKTSCVDYDSFRKSFLNRL